MSVPVLLAIASAGALAVRFNRPLARAHVALFKGSREPPRPWEMFVLRTAWLVAGIAVSVVALLTLAGIVAS